MSVELDGVNNILKTDTISEVTSANGVTIDGVNIKDSKIVTANSVDSDVYVDGSIDTAHIADLNVTTGKIAADAITGAKIADNAINSEHYTDGSIDTAHIADGQVTVGKLATAVFTGATDIGADIVDADLFLMDDGAGGTIRKTTASRIKTYAAGGGKIGQVVQTVKTDVFSTTSSSFVDVTGLTVNITPSATSSKILVNVNLSIHSSDNAISGQLFRDSTQIALGDASSNRARSFGSGAYGGTIGNTILLYPNTSFLDSPNTSSQVTYKVKGAAVGGGTLYYGRTHDDTDNSQFARTIQSITVMEVLA